MIKLIAAVGKNAELGRNNDLIWHLKEDMRYFKETTMGCVVVMGRKTYESIGKPLPGRENIVITSREINGVTTVQNPKEILRKQEDIFIIGGASIYEYFIDYAEEIYLTEIDATEEAQVFFPKFDKSLYDREVIKASKEDDISFEFVVYRRKK